MRSLVVTTPASDTTLLTLAELRTAAGASTLSDTELRNLGDRVAASITSECNIAVGAGAEPTLRQEMLTETIYGPRGGDLMLSRRHNVSVTSISVDGSALSTGDYVVDSENGFVQRLARDDLREWSGRIALVVYQAGFATVPGDLKQAAMDCFRAMLAEATRDPLVKSETKDVTGVGSHSRDYWVGSLPGQSNEGPVPDAVAGQLKRFRNLAIG